MRSFLKLFLCPGLLSFLAFSTHSTSALAQSADEIENEVSIGESDAAMAEEKQMKQLEKETEEKEKAAQNAALVSSQARKKKTALIRAHIEQMKVDTNKANRARQKSLDQIKIDEKEIKALEKTEETYKIKLDAAQSLLTATNKDRDQLTDKINKAKEAIANAKEREAKSKADLQTAKKQLAEAQKNLHETAKTQAQEEKRVALSVKKLGMEQKSIEDQIRASSLKIKKLTDDLEAQRRKEVLAQDNHKRAVDLKNENDAELTRLQKLKKGPSASASPAN